MVNCFLPDCKSHSKEAEELKTSFHEIPVDAERRDQWLDALTSVTNLDFRKITEACKLCGRHFKDSDFIYYKSKRCLKKEAVPSIFEPYPQKSIQAVKGPIAVNVPTLNKNFKVLAFSTEKSFPNAAKIIQAIKEGKIKPDIPSKKVTGLTCKPKVFYLKKQEGSGTTQLSLPKTCTPIIENVVSLKEKEQKKEKTRLIGRPPGSKNKNSFTVRQGPTYEKLKARLKESQNKVNSVKKQLWRLSKKRADLDSKLEDCANKLEFYENNTLIQNVAKMELIYKKGLADKHIEFTLNQVRNFDKKKPYYPENIMRECALLHAKSKKCYQMVSDSRLFSLPTDRTVRRYTDILKKKAESGFEDSEGGMCLEGVYFSGEHSYTNPGDIRNTSLAEEVSIDKDCELAEEDSQYNRDELHCKETDESQLFEAMSDDENDEACSDDEDCESNDDVEENRTAGGGSGCEDLLPWLPD